MEANIEIVPFHLGLANRDCHFGWVCLRRKFAAFCGPFFFCGTPLVEQDWELDSVAELQLSVAWKLVAV